MSFQVLVPYEVWYRGDYHLPDIRKPAGEQVALRGGEEEECPSEDRPGDRLQHHGHQPGQGGR